jgi:hypothetical protein
MTDFSHRAFAGVDAAPLPLHSPAMRFLRWPVILTACVLAASVSTGAQPVLVQSSPEASPARPFVNSLGQKFVRLPETAVLMSVWETRVQDFEAYLRANRIAPSPLPAGLLPAQPACNLSWNDATAFARWLTRVEQAQGRIGEDDRYRLPSDAEWSLAVGAGRYPWGSAWPPPENGSEAGGYHPGDGAHTAPVGSFPANALGLHDLGGNVFEWCLDWYERRMNPSEIRVEFKRLDDDGGGRRYKFLRGASWAFHDPLNLMSAYRYPAEPDQRGGLYGFRLVLELDGPRPPQKGFPPPPQVKTGGTPRSPAPELVRGRVLLAGRCTECHQAFDPVPYDNDSWVRLMDSMRGKAKLRGTEAADLDAYLATLRTAKGSDR